MTTLPTRRPNGYTLFEVAFVVAAMSVIMLTATQVFGSSEGLMNDSRAELHVHGCLRANLEALVTALSGADVDSLTGFDADGVSTAPNFRRVLGVGATGRIYGPLESLRWRAVNKEVDGVHYPGEVVHLVGTQEQVIARCVPLDGFQVAWDGDTLVVMLKTYGPAASTRSVVVSNSTAIQVRN